jgi:glycerol-3-phosphate dehydrogenase
LLDLLNGHLAQPVSVDQIVSLRCGVRPLAADHSYTGGNTLQISRRHRIHCDSDRPWISVYGGKISNCVPLAEKLASQLCEQQDKAPPPIATASEIETANFPGLDEPAPSPEWCARNEMACTLEDYLRRRTNI